MANKSNVNFPGKWIFKVDDVELVDGGCNKDGFMAIQPNIVSYAGNEDIILFGPCFNSNDSHKLHVDEKSFVECDYVDQTTLRCKTVFFEYLGTKNVKLIINDGERFIQGHKCGRFRD